MKKKTIILTAILALILCGVYVYSNVAGSASPTDGETVYVGTNTSKAINHSFTFTTTPGNITSLNTTLNLTFWTNFGGTWHLNQSNGTAISGNKSFSFYLDNVTRLDEANTTIWNIRLTNMTHNFTWLFSSNNTYNIDFIDIPTVNFEVPSNDSMTDSATPTINISYTASDTPLSCCLWRTNVSATAPGNVFYEEECKTDVVNVTNKTFGGPGSPWPLTADGKYRFFMNCSKTGSGISNSTSRLTLNHDSTAPSVNVTSPSSASIWWSAGKTVNFTLVPVDIFINTCELWTDCDSAWHLNQTDTSITNGGSTNFVALNLSENHTGCTWGYMCNDTFGNDVVANYTLKVDNTTVDGFNCTTLANNTKSTDYTPTVGWTGVFDLGFSNYTIYFNNGSVGNQYNYTVTDNSTVTYEIINNLTKDMQWYYNISAFDNVGNREDASNCSGTGFIYTTDSVGHDLLAGYNFYSVVREITNPSQLGASGICGEISVTPTSISRFNSTHSWESHVCGSSTNNFSIAKYDAVVINMPVTSVWEEGRVWALNGSSNINISNSSGTGWNLIGVDSDETFASINLGNNNMSKNEYNVTRAFDAPNETSTTTVTSTYSLVQSRLSGMIAVYNGSVLVPKADYTVDLDNGLFTLLANSTAPDYRNGTNFTFDYRYFDVQTILFMSYPNHTQTYMPYKNNWSYNSGVNLYDGDALWVLMNNSIVTTMLYNRSVWSE